MQVSVNSCTWSLDSTGMSLSRKTNIARLLEEWRHAVGVKMSIEGGKASSDIIEHRFHVRFFPSIVKHISQGIISSSHVFYQIINILLSFRNNSALIYED